MEVKGLTQPTASLVFILCLVVVQEVHEDLHDAREDHHTGAGGEEDVDVVK